MQMQIMNILSQNQMMKMKINNLIQNPLMMCQMNNILNILIYNQTIMNELKNMLYLEMNMNMMNVNNHINMMNIDNKNNMMNNSLKENFVHIFFEKNTGEGLTNVVVQCGLSENIKDVIKRYRNKSLDNKEEEKFIYNGLSLNLSITVREASFANFSKVIVILTQDIIGE